MKGKCMEGKCMEGKCRFRKCIECRVKVLGGEVQVIKEGMYRGKEFR